MNAETQQLRELLKEALTHIQHLHLALNARPNTDDEIHILGEAELFYRDAWKSATLTVTPHDTPTND